MFGSLLSIIAVASLFIAGAIVPVSWAEGIPLCFFHEITGWDCPGCGLTRAWLSLFHGDFRRSIQLNALAPVVILLFLLYGVDHLRTVCGTRSGWRTTPRGQRWIGGSFLILFLGQWFWKLGRHWVGG